MPQVSVPDSASTQIVAANYNRTLLVITNTSASVNCYINFGAAATSSNAYIPAGGNLTLAGDGIYKGAVNGISASGSININYSELANGR